MRHEFETLLAQSWPPEQWQDVTVLVAVSGGADSMALLRALHALKTASQGRLIVAHANHQLRGAESDDDERFVCEQCARLEVDCEVGRVPVGELADVQGDGIEAAARHARYGFLTDTAHHVGARFVAIAHTADDQAETILHRILRGTGIAGLAGSPRTRPLSVATTLIRPLLDRRRGEVLAYLDALGQPFRQDTSNRELRFTRNRIRHELLPHLAAHYNPAVIEALLRLGAVAGECRQAIARQVDELYAAAVDERFPDSIVLRRPALASAPRYIVRELLVTVWRHRGWPEQAMGHAEWNRLVQLATANKTATETFPGNVMAQATGAELRLTRETAATALFDRSL
jgi:tRNA(Ile)-lysidine synthase